MSDKTISELQDSLMHNMTLPNQLKKLRTKEPMLHQFLEFFLEQISLVNYQSWSVKRIKEEIGYVLAHMEYDWNEEIYEEIFSREKTKPMKPE